METPSQKKQSQSHFYFTILRDNATEPLKHRFFFKFKVALRGELTLQTTKVNLSCNTERKNCHQRKLQLPMPKISECVINQC